MQKQVRTAKGTAGLPQNKKDSKENRRLTSEQKRTAKGTTDLAQNKKGQQY